MELSKLSKDEKLKLYNKAKEAYYNGQEIMSDYEFDCLEEELNLDNKSYIGTRHNPSYTVKHPYIMGSLYKVQIHKGKDDYIDWNLYYNQINKYLHKNVKNPYLIITPKFDGCSFEVLIDNSKVKSISSRGDGQYGKDQYNWLINKIPESLIKDVPEKTYTLRGEVLVNKNDFIKKYSEDFTNPRSFVSGVLNNKWSEDNKFKDMVDDLKIVIYDYRVYDNGIWLDKDWVELLEYTNHKEVFPNMYHCCDTVIDTPESFNKIYDAYAKYRTNSVYNLDGIVIKPISDIRENNVSNGRPLDCVAIKFLPMINTTKVTSITWGMGKTHELIPIINIDPVYIDDRKITKCSGHNYGYIINNKISKVTEVQISLAGDIIPFLYKVVDNTKYSEDNVMQELYSQYPDIHIDNIHAYALISDEEKSKYQFLNSATVLNIPGVGIQTTKDIFEYMTKSYGETDEFFGESKRDIPNNILLCSHDDIYFGTGSGKSGSNAKKGFENVLKSLSLSDIIRSCNFRLCGSKVSEQIANKLLGKEYDFSHLANIGWAWVDNKSSEQMKQVNRILDYMGKSIEDFKVIYEKKQKESSNQIPIIMTGEPNDYKSKGEFLRYHPEYRQTGSWKEVKIVFTNSLESTTGKMKKAKEKGIEIRLY